MLFPSVALLALSLANIGYSQSVGFDAREATIDTVHQSLFSGLTTCRDIVSSFISRIETHDRYFNAIITLNPSALDIAERLDKQLSAGNATSSLFCVPILLKDNYDTFDMPTTGGNLAFNQSQPTTDAPTVTALRRAGAVILGKANLHELALEGISVSSLGGQTINPYDFTRTPGGSSGGSAAAVAVSFAVFATGTDTVNSLRSPASANSLFSIRPTRGLVSRTGIIPISYTQDVAGAIARTVKDVAIALTAMASVGYDPADNTTALIPASSIGVDYALDISTGALKGLRLGVINGFYNRTADPETTPVNNIMDAMIGKLSAAGTTIIPINEPIYNVTAILAKLDTQRYEYRESMDAYLSAPALSGPRPHTLTELYVRPPGEFLVLPAQYEYVTTALASSTSNVTYATVQAGIRNLTVALQSTFSRNNLDALVYPEQQNLVVKLGAPSQSGRNGILAALTGSPVVTVPAGFSEPSEDAPIGVPHGMEILGRPFEEAKLLRIAYQVEQLTHVRRPPIFAKEIIEAKAYESVPVIKPDNGNIPKAYPVGVL